MGKTSKTHDKARGLNYKVGSDWKPVCVDKWFIPHNSTFRLDSFNTSDFSPREEEKEMWSPSNQYWQTLTPSTHTLMWPIGHPPPPIPHTQPTHPPTQRSFYLANIITSLTRLVSVPARSQTNGAAAKMLNRDVD